jgi:hypothetical protein
VGTKIPSRTSYDPCCRHTVQPVLTHC